MPRGQFRPYVVSARAPERKRERTHFDDQALFGGIGAARGRERGEEEEEHSK